MKFLIINKLTKIRRILFLVIFLFFLVQVNLSSKVVIEASKLFSFPGSVTFSNDKNPLPKTLRADELVKPIIISESESENIFNSENDEIIINNFPISPSENATVELIKSIPAVRIGTNWTIITNEGEKQLRSFEPSFYSGKIKGLDNSKITVYYLNGNLYSIIERDGYDNYSITPVVGNSEKSAHIITSQKTSSLGNDYNPFLDVHNDEEKPDYELLKKLSEQPLSTELLQADIIIEATYDFYKIFNDMNKLTAYIGAVMTHVSQIFQSNVSIQLFVPQVVIQSNQATDPYRTTTQIIDRLYQVQEQWRKKTVKRALVCLMTDIDYQGGSGGYRIGGVSLSLGTLCNNNQGYCVFGMQGHYKYPTTNYTWDVSVSAHELGHAFGSPHTHSCYFRPNMIDTCITRDKPQANSDGCVTSGNPIPRPGTLMSYCHLTNSTNSVGLYFHERQIPIIRGFAEQASCLKKAIDPTLILLNPYGGSVLFPGDRINIKWASAKVEYVAIKYSLDDGTTWKWIEQYAEALSGSFMWIVPDTMTSNLKILIQDSYNAYLSDETKTPLTIDRPQFLLQTPSTSDRIGQDSKYKIKWDHKYLDNFKILFTSEGDKIGSGEEIWSTVITGVSGYNYDWEVPDVESNTCRIKIIGTTEFGAEYSQVSGLFSIGKPHLNILYPSPYDKLCAEQNCEIKWESDFISGMYVQYTTDNGEKWKQVRFSPINGFDGSYVWKTPSAISENYILRFSNFDNRDIVYAVSSKPFFIDSCETNVDEFGNKIIQTKLEILDIIPNPAMNIIKLTFNNKSVECDTYDILISNEQGKIVEVVHNNNLMVGIQSVEMELNKLSQGNYYLILQSCDEKTGAALKILR